MTFKWQSHVSTGRSAGNEMEPDGPGQIFWTLQSSLMPRWASWVNGEWLEHSLQAPTARVPVPAPRPAAWEPRQLTPPGQASVSTSGMGTGLNHNPSEQCHTGCMSSAHTKGLLFLLLLLLVLLLIVLLLYYYFFFFFKRKCHLFICRTLQQVGSYFPDQGSNPCPLHWERRVLTTGPPGKCLHYYFYQKQFM